MLLFTCLRTFLIVGVVLIPTIKGVAQDQHHKPGVLSQIETLNRVYEKCEDDGDIDCIMDLYDPDVTVITLEATYKGSQVIRSIFSRLFPLLSDLKIVSDELIPLDDEALFVFEGKHFSLVDNDGKLIKTGKVLTIWKKTSEGYKILVEILKHGLNTIMHMF